MPGTMNRILLQSVGDAYRQYQVGLSFGTEPGIPTAAGTIPLHPDPLLAASLGGAPGFRRFSGLLDSTARAEGTLELPPLPGLSGFRIFVAYVILDAAAPGGIRTISGAVPLFVQPSRSGLSRVFTPPSFRAVGG